MVDSKQIFVSYDSEDELLSHRIAEDLQRLGARVWIAPDSIPPGETWVEAIDRGLQESTCVLVLLTAAGMDSRWVKKEISVAIELERKGVIELIPLDVEPCDVPPLLSSYQKVSFRESYERGLRQLIENLGLNQGARWGSLNVGPSSYRNPSPVTEALIQGYRRGMTIEGVIDRLRPIFSFNLGVDPTEIRLDSTLDDFLGKRPTASFFLIQAIEKEFKIEGLSGDFSALKSVADLAAYVVVGMKKSAGQFAARLKGENETPKS